MKELKQALVNPASVFAKPSEVVCNPAFSRKQKIDVLRRWEYVARMLQVNRESKVDESEELLGEILESLHHQLDYWPDLRRSRIED